MLAEARLFSWSWAVGVMESWSGGSTHHSNTPALHHSSFLTSPEDRDVAEIARRSGLEPLPRSINHDARSPLETP